MFARVAAAAAASKSDPFEGVAFGAAERAIKRVLDPISGTWTESPLLVKLEPESFAQGALRKCYRMRLHDGADWAHSSSWVAKKYMRQFEDAESERAMCEADIKVQMLSKYHGEKFSEHQVPKRIQFQFAFFMELIDRPTRDVFAVEAFMPGNYVKWNNNSGMFDVANFRLTPQAFSHFSWVNSKHELLICDIQGVGDLWTDPNVHSLDTSEFGEGNLGIRGMALFFYTHECNDICSKVLKLPPVKLFAPPRASPKHSPALARADTKVWLHEAAPGHSLSREETQRSLDSISFRGGLTRSMSAVLNTTLHPSPRAPSQPVPLEHASVLQPLPDSVPLTPSLPALLQYELAKMHETGRTLILDAMLAGLKEPPSPDTPVNKDAVIFHLQTAAHMGLPSAQLRLARMLCGLDEFLDLKNVELGHIYLEMAATAQTPCAMVHVAQRKEQQGDLHSAIIWLEMWCSWWDGALPERGDEGPLHAALKVVETNGWELELQPYEVHGRLAALYEKQEKWARAAALYRSAAEDAMGNMKGKLSASYFEKAELCDSM